MSSRKTPAPSRRWRWAVLVLVLALLAGGFAARGLWAEQKADIRSGTTLVDADGLAARYGVKVTLLAVTAAGGLSAPLPGRRPGQG